MRKRPALYEVISQRGLRGLPQRPERNGAPPEMPRVQEPEVRAVAVEEPKPKPEPEPARDRSDSSDLPRVTPGRAVRVPPGYIALAVVGFIAIGVLGYVLGYHQHRREVAQERKQALSQEQPPFDPLAENTGGNDAPADPAEDTGTNGSNGGSSGERSAGSNGSSEQTNPPSNGTTMPSHSPIIIDKDMSDPREKGLRYFRLGEITRSAAIDAAEFLHAKGVPAAAIRTSRGNYIVYALRGFAPDELDSEERSAFEQKLRLIGREYEDKHNGIDFADMYLALYTG